MERNSKSGIISLILFTISMYVPHLFFWGAIALMRFGVSNETNDSIIGILLIMGRSVYLCGNVYRATRFGVRCVQFRTRLRRPDDNHNVLQVFAYPVVCGKLFVLADTNGRFLQSVDVARRAAYHSFGSVYHLDVCGAWQCAQLGVRMA